MIKFSYADGTEICDYADGNITKRQSKFIEKIGRASCRERV